jgi:hypothetical protein
MGKLGDLTLNAILVKALELSKDKKEKEVKEFYETAKQLKSIVDNLEDTELEDIIKEIMEDGVETFMENFQKKMDVESLIAILEKEKLKPNQNMDAVYSLVISGKAYFEGKEVSLSGEILTIEKKIINMKNPVQSKKDLFQKLKNKKLKIENDEDDDCDDKDDSKSTGRPLNMKNPFDLFFT